jgi:hypothetical protein
MFTQSPIPFPLPHFGQLLGVVQVRVGDAVHTLQVQAMNIVPDVIGHAAGGLFEEDGQFGIMVNMHAGAKDVEKHVHAAAEEAARVLQKRLMH